MPTEMERGRSEAAHTVIKPVDLKPYLAPPPDTPYPLRYAFYLMGDLVGRTVLDLGCGSGENLSPLLARGARVIAVDLSPELIDLARKRVEVAKFAQPHFMVGSALQVPLSDGSVDAVLCASLLHHLNIPSAMAEIRRLLKPGGFVVIKEPVRFSKLAGKIRKLFPAQEDTSDDEHPLTWEEVGQVKNGWKTEGERAFRLPIIPLLARDKVAKRIWALDRLLLKSKALEHFSTSRVMKLVA